mmetsp:Transcript_25291/g.50450  ORF Transcript_25291/g.50450 Transcript_25291/m.50450 type:complete len:266 (-) Transcript_25291:1096-1893(-)
MFVGMGVLVAKFCAVRLGDGDLGANPVTRAVVLDVNVNNVRVGVGGSQNGCFDGRLDRAIRRVGAADAVSTQDEAGFRRGAGRIDVGDRKPLNVVDVLAPELVKLLDGGVVESNLGVRKLRGEARRCVRDAMSGVEQILLGDVALVSTNCGDLCRVLDGIGGPHDLRVELVVGAGLAQGKLGRHGVVRASAGRGVLQELDVRNGRGQVDEAAGRGGHSHSLSGGSRGGELNGLVLRLPVAPLSEFDLPPDPLYDGADDEGSDGAV